MLYSAVSFYEVNTSADIPDPMPEGTIFFVKTENAIKINHGDIVGVYGTLLDDSVVLPTASLTEAGITQYATDEEASVAAHVNKALTPGNLEVLLDHETALQEAIEAEAATREANDNTLAQSISVVNSKLRYMPSHDFGTDTPDPADLTAWALGHTGLTEVANGTVIVNDFDDIQWVYSDDDATWVKQGASTVAPATNTSAGVVTGDATTDGGVRVVEATNKLAVNGWNAVKTSITNLANDVASRFAALKVSIAQGGTGATTLAQAKINLEIPDPVAIGTNLVPGIVKGNNVNAGAVGIDSTTGEMWTTGWGELQAQVDSVLLQPSTSLMGYAMGKNVVTSTSTSITIPEVDVGLFTIGDQLVIRVSEPGGAVAKVVTVTGYTNSGGNTVVSFTPPITGSIISGASVCMGKKSGSALFVPVATATTPGVVPVLPTSVPNEVQIDLYIPSFVGAPIATDLLEYSAKSCFFWKGSDIVLVSASYWMYSITYALADSISVYSPNGFIATGLSLSAATQSKTLVPMALYATNPVIESGSRIELRCSQNNRNNNVQGLVISLLGKYV